MRLLYNRLIFLIIKYLIMAGTPSEQAILMDELLHGLNRAVNEIGIEELRSVAHPLEGIVDGNIEENGILWEKIATESGRITTLDLLLHNPQVMYRMTSDESVDRDAKFFDKVCLAVSPYVSNEGMELVIGIRDDNIQEAIRIAEKWDDAPAWSDRESRSAELKKIIEQDLPPFVNWLASLKEEELSGINISMLTHQRVLDIVTEATNIPFEDWCLELDDEQTLKAQEKIANSMNAAGVVEGDLDPSKITPVAVSIPATELVKMLNKSS
jgi:hypothetical protein